ncbi:helix-turn-helix domain-containing protein [Methylocystis sp. IM3]|uniref:helix-turn-helix transcriptional regulator n=1 Tax=unclassified Methylocystis TaxID=2625913 RepID=UPI0030F98C9B
MQRDSSASSSRALLTEKEAAEFLSVTDRVLQAWRVRGGGPAFVKLGRCVRYRVADLEAFIAAGVRRHTSEGAR